MPYIANQYAMVSPNNSFPCSGKVTQWSFQGNRSESFRAIVWRPVEGSSTEFAVVGFNDIPSGNIRSGYYTVPADERISVKPGDVIGWFGEPLLTFRSEGHDIVFILSETMDPVVNETWDFKSDFAYRQYAIEADVVAFEGKFDFHILRCLLDEDINVKIVEY